MEYARQPLPEKPGTVSPAVTPALGEVAVVAADQQIEQDHGTPIIRLPKARRYAATYDDETTKGGW